MQSCSERPDEKTTNSTFSCRPLYHNYYCNETNKFVYNQEFSNVDDTKEQVLYSTYANRDWFIMWIYFMNILAFLSFSFIHHLKAGEIKGFDKYKTIKKVKK